jgi:hypothetical protein
MEQKRKTLVENFLYSSGITFAILVKSGKTPVKMGSG